MTFDAARRESPVIVGFEVAGIDCAGGLVLSAIALETMSDARRWQRGSPALREVTVYAGPHAALELFLRGEGTLAEPED
jgi:hypothetical protein